MPFARRPDSWLIIPGSTGPRKRVPASPISADDPLSAFSSETSAQTISSAKPAPAVASEKPAQVILVPGARPVAPRVVKRDVTTPARRIQNSPIVREAATQRPAVRKPKRFHPIAAAAAYARKTRALATDVKNLPAWVRQVPNIGGLATSGVLVAFAGGTAAGVLAMWLAGAPPSSNAVQVTMQSFAPRISPPLTALPAPRAEVRRAAEGLRQVGTTGRRAAGPSQPASPARAASTAAAKPRAAAATPASRYKGSLAFRSEPQGAKVFLNGTFVGSTPLVLENLPVGSRAVRFEADGYQRWSASTRVVADRQTGVSATLAPARP